MLLVGALLFFWQRERILQGIGQFLVKEDRPQKADLIVCLSGSWADRTLTAADLYRAGWGRKVFLFREERPVGYQQLLQRGIHLPETCDLARQILLRSGLPRSAIYSGERESTSTYDEACQIEEFLRGHPLSSLILVTSKFHSRRAYLTFRSQLNQPGLRILSLPTPYDEFDPRDWWKRERSREWLVLEYQKLLVSLLRGRIRLSLLLRGG
ncbi:MAG: YdcF family protein [candidate division NC10 bacterium]|nr:YdcF family protein [candidate division NC10 bacterium]